MLRLHIQREKRMEKKYYIRGYKEEAEFPILYDFEAYPLGEAIAKAKEYFEKIGLLSKIILFAQNESDEKKAEKFTYRNKLAILREIDWWENN